MMLSIVTMELRQVLRIEEFDLFDFDYPLHKDLKKEFESTFKDHYFFYEIGSETIDRFKHNLKASLRMKTPYYNKLYETTKLEVDPFITYKLKEEFGESQEATSQSSSNNQDSTTRTDYPQTSNSANDIPSEKMDSKGSTGVNSSGGSTRDYDKKVEGLQGNQNELLRQYRENILDIIQQLILELKDLFILVY